MLFLLFLSAAAVCSIGPAVLFCVNLRRFRAPAPVSGEELHRISVLIPARNEEANIRNALKGVLASRGVELELLVLDDDSTDRTGELVGEIAARDPRVRLLHGEGLPRGWNGKQHACWVLAQEATQPLLVFLDADVRIEPELLVRMAAFRQETRTALVSGFPRLITMTWLEQLLLPLIHFVLLAFLPMRSMRQHTWPSAAAGCGQFLMVERDAYFASGGHSAIRETMHDGLLLPRVLRRAGHRTDIADITELASVRMYDSAAKVWSGLAKNATEGIATVGKIVPLSLVLIFGQVVPVLVALYLIVMAITLGLLRFAGPATFFWLLSHHLQSLATMYMTAHGSFAMQPSSRAAAFFFTSVCVLCLTVTYLPRLLAVHRFRQPLRSALLHPLGILALLCVQWYAFLRKLVGKPVGWRQRNYSSGTGAEVGG